MYPRFILALFALSIVISSCQTDITIDDFEPKQVNNAGLNWYSVDDLGQVTNLDGKLVLVDMYTDWCGWCKRMDRQTFNDPKVAAYLNEHFVAVKFNAEQKDPITYKGQTYGSKKVGRKSTNQLALDMMNGRAVYPTIVFLNENFEVIESKVGFKKPDQMMAHLKNIQAKAI